MRVLLIDECLPRKLAERFTGRHVCRTVADKGWSAGKKNGELLALADDEFDVLITLDKGLQYQQNLAGRHIAVLIVEARSHRLQDLIARVPACLEAIAKIRPGQVVRLPLPD